MNSREGLAVLVFVLVGAVLAVRYDIGLVSWMVSEIGFVAFSYFFGRATRRRAFVARHEPLPDDVFLCRMQPLGDVSTDDALRARGAVAGILGIPAPLLAPEANVQLIARDLNWINSHDIGALRDELRDYARRDGNEPDYPGDTIRAWVLFVARQQGRTAS